MKSKILITAGHAGSTAYALITTIKKYMPECELVFVGSESAIEGSKIPTLENTYFPKIGVSYIKIIMGRIQRKFTLWTVPSILKIPIGFFHAFFILHKVKPRVIVSFGGFSAFPIVVVGRILRVPVIIHEQTAAAGRANQLSAYFANVIALSHKESMKYFPSKKCQVVGNPISSEVVMCKNKKEDIRKHAILITGGSRGSKIINNCVKNILSQLLKHFTIYHQTGYSDFERFHNLSLKLNDSIKRRYYPFATVEMWNWYKYLRDSDFIISRSGANIVSEATYLKMPAIYIPLSISYKDEQTKNALIAEKVGLAQIIAEDELTEKKIIEKVNYISKNWDVIIKNAKSPQVDDSKASYKLYKLVSKYA